MNRSEPLAKSPGVLLAFLLGLVVIPWAHVDAFVLDTIGLEVRSTFAPLLLILSLVALGTGTQIGARRGSALGGFVASLAAIAISGGVWIHVLTKTLY